ncbi:MAG: hypothetical protein J5666_01245 [Bacilli bacterium]|nr:hypothetical protein [Bacilli bacterium]
MSDTLFKRILMIIFILGIISVITLLIITVILYNQVSMITFIEKEVW